MTAAHLHLMVVHLPVVLCPVALGLMAYAMWRREDAVLKVGYVLLIVAAAMSAVAFYSGPPAYDLIREERAAEKAYLGPEAQAIVEDHAVAARAAFLCVLLAGVLALQALLQFFQDEPPARWLRLTLLGATLLGCYLLAWSAHLGGQVSHPEIREPASILFPRLS